MNPKISMISLNDVLMKKLRNSTMCKDLFGNEFDFNRDGNLDSFESRATFTTRLELICREEDGNKSLSDLSGDKLHDLAAKSGIAPSGFGL